MSRVNLNRRLVLEGAQRQPDGAGGFAEVWQPVGTVWAEVIPGTGREAGLVEATIASVSYRITVRGAPDGAPSRPRPDQRFRDSSRVFRILAVTERDRRGQYLTCFAQEEVPT
jgi:head-tail adaptor